ncbi:hypothetical protein JCM33374_g5596 [Metschnikowia sp. JCM 33374]|nr:hypothetical protein JCM33374_g5596 [Metschnikowia sp. JCM 33374]
MRCSLTSSTRASRKTTTSSPSSPNAWSWSSARSPPTLPGRARCTQIAASIRELVLQPFTKWCKEHESRIGYSEQVVTDKYKKYSASKTELERLQKKYFNKCRVVEDFKTHYTEDELNQAIAEASGDHEDGSDASDDDDDDDENIYTFGGAVYGLGSTKKLLADIIRSIEMSSHKVPILGTYHNVSSGSDIAQWLLDNMPELRGSVAKAEAFGQDLVTHGFIRLIGSMSASKNFINSSSFLYQWKPVVFDLTKLSDLDMSKSAKPSAYDPLAASGLRANHFSNYIEDMKQAMGVAAVDYNDKSQYAKLVKEVSDLDAQYYESTKALDAVRCEFEETVMDHLAFMQKCESDRLKAVKKATFDFISAFSNKINSMKHSCDKLLIVEETMHPATDLKFLIENYATGKFSPRVTLYDNYYNSNIKQNFGVDLNVKARLDKKAVPLLIQVVLSYLDSLYPELDNDQERVDLWTKPVHLSKVHQLRSQLNEQREPQHILSILKSAQPMTVTNVVKLYFMELPDSIVSHTFFDLIKTLYSSYAVGSDEPTADKSRVTGLQNTLTELPVCNLATLDALLTHLTRLVQIISSKDEALSVSLQEKLCREFGALVLRPKSGSAEIEGKSVHAFNMATETLQKNFITDLFLYKEVIFGELRRRNSQKPSRNNSGKAENSRNGSLKSNAGQTSKLRLESKLKTAVHNATEKSPEKSPEKSRANSVTLQSAPQVHPPSTPPPKTTKESTSVTRSTLKRSTSPNKKKLNSFLEKKESATGANSSKPKKPDLVYNSANTSDSDLSKFRLGSGSDRTTSERDTSQSSFVASSPTPKDRRRPVKEDVIVVD